MFDDLIPLLSILTKQYKRSKYDTSFKICSANTLLLHRYNWHAFQFILSILPYIELWMLLEIKKRVWLFNAKQISKLSWHSFFSCFNCILVTHFLQMAFAYRNTSPNAFRACLYNDDSLTQQALGLKVSSIYTIIILIFEFIKRLI